VRNSFKSKKESMKKQFILLWGLLLGVNYSYAMQWLKDFLYPKDDFVERANNQLKPFLIINGIGEKTHIIRYIKNDNDKNHWLVEIMKDKGDHTCASLMSNDAGEYIVAKQDSDTFMYYRWNFIANKNGSSFVKIRQFNAANMVNEQEMEIIVMDHKNK
jgi:hypothetical protein